MTTDLEQSYKNKYRLYVQSYIREATPWFRSRMAQFVAIRREQLINAGVTEERIEALEAEVNDETKLVHRAVAEFLAADEPPQTGWFEGDTEPITTEFDASAMHYVFVPFWDESDEGGK